jgi:hypothetical protein
MICAMIFFDREDGGGVVVFRGGLFGFKTRFSKRGLFFSFCAVALIFCAAAASAAPQNIFGAGRAGGDVESSIRALNVFDLSMAARKPGRLETETNPLASVCFIIASAILRRVIFSCPMIISRTDFSRPERKKTEFASHGACIAARK